MNLEVFGSACSRRREKADNREKLHRSASSRRRLRIWTLASSLVLCLSGGSAETFRVATYNIENFLEESTDTRPAKTAQAKGKVCENILALKPDVIALQEMGDLNALNELRELLKAGGLNLPYSHHMTGFDTNIHLAVLSKFPFRDVISHTNDTFLLDDRLMHVSRGFAEVEIEVNTNYTFTLITAHLKSKRPIGIVDENELRQEEAKQLRGKIDAVFDRTPNARIVVLGDLNDTPDAKSTKAVIGRGKHKLVDTRPSERNGDTPIPPKRSQAPRSIAWTHFYALEDTYSRLDYILLSPAMARNWVTNETFVLTVPNWGLASDHRPILATFTTAE